MTTSRIRLDRYERGIAASLVREFGYRQDQARALVVAYLPVIKKLGRYDNCGDYAEYLHLASQRGLTPEIWLRRIRHIEEGEARDDSIRTREHALT